MRQYLLLVSSVVLLAFGAACAKTEPPAAPEPKAPEFLPTATVREVMDSLMDPTSDYLWKAVSTESTEKGFVEKAPKTEDDWKAVRRQAVALMEASNLLLIPGRHVAKPGEKAQDTNAQLPPEQIEALIAKDPASWQTFAHGLHDAVSPILKAIDAKDVMGLSDGGDGLDKACESCHLKYWYPGEAKKAE